ncbi:MAG: L,D-transpeptidase [Beijerinckiaceae bacterium]|nr:L,D-transpeptidase [Beijerinckiaceae bacterium]
MASFISRRQALSLGGAALASGAAGLIGSARSQQVMKEIHDLKPGEFTWHPERSPQGPVAVVTSIPEQLVHVYRNGVRIAVSTCSTGAPGHATPTGVFTVLQKDAHHHSSTYNNAPMPNMNRLTWGGIALHAGKLPGYPASHGCIRLPMEFSAKLFEVTHIGTPVIIAGSHTDPWDLIHPGLALGSTGASEFADAVSKLKGRAHPSDWSEGQARPITTVVASSSDRSVTLLENGSRLALGALEITGEPRLGEHVFVLRSDPVQGDGLAWQGISHHPDPAQPKAKEEALMTRITANPDFRDALRQVMHPGMILVVTDLPAGADTRTGSDFVIMSTG